jgi:hypothetical protein
VEEPRSGRPTNAAVEALGNHNRQSYDGTAHRDGLLGCCRTGTHQRRFRINGQTYADSGLSLSRKEPSTEVTTPEVFEHDQSPLWRVEVTRPSSNPLKRYLT